MSSPGSVRVGLVSDTHGLLRPEARAFLLGCDTIVHGGDVGAAAVIAVRGNNDTGPWAARLRSTELIRVGTVFLFGVHDIDALDIEPAAAGVRIVVFGHSHRPSIEDRAGILYVNPGSCGPRRFKLPVTVGEITVSPHAVQARIHPLID